MKPLLTTAALLISIVTAGCDVSCNIVSETPVPGPNELSTRSIAINFTLDKKKEVTSMELCTFSMMGGKLHGRLNTT